MQNNVILWWLIAHTSTKAEHRRVGKITPDGGWKAFVEQTVQPAVQWVREGGFKPRVMFHNPFGVDAGEGSDADQWIEARERGLQWLTDDYIPLMYGLASAGVEVITYLGGWAADPDFRQLVEEGRIDAYLWRFWRSTRPALLVGSCGFDATTPFSLDHPITHLVMAVDSLYKMSGRPGTVYIEATPDFDHAHWYDYSKVVVESVYERRHGPHPHPGAWKRFPHFNSATRTFDQLDGRGSTIKRDLYRGEIVRLCVTDQDVIGGDKRNPEYVEATFRRIVADGHTMAACFDTYRTLRPAKSLLA